MKLLFLSHYFPPEVNAPASRIFEHAKVWAADGHQVTVVTCAPNHPFGRVYDGYSNRRGEEVIDGIRVVRLQTYITANEGFAKRTLGYLSYFFAVVLASRSFGSFDLVVSTSPQFFNGLAGYFVSRIKRLPWVLEIRDLWPDSILAVGAISNRLIIRALYWLENFCYRESDRIVVVTDAFKRYMVAKGVAESKISVIKNGVDLQTFKAEMGSSSALGLQELEIENLAEIRQKFVVSYVGTHGMAHGLNTVLEAAAILRGNRDIHFILVGDGAEKGPLMKLCQSLALANVTMLPQKPKKLMPMLWQLTDLSLVHLKKNDLFKTVIPSKIFEAMAMAKPILLGVEGESAELIERSGAGLTIEPGNAQAMARAVLALANDSSTCESMAARGREFVQKNFDRQVLARQYEQLLAELLGDRETGAKSRTSEAGAVTYRPRQQRKI